MHQNTKKIAIFVTEKQEYDHKRIHSLRFSLETPFATAVC